MKDSTLGIIFGFGACLLFLLFNISNLRTQMDYYILGFGALGLVLIPSILGILFGDNKKTGG